MDLFIIPRRMARLEYRTARLPFTILDERVVARRWDGQALPRLGFELFLGLMDGVAGWLLADDHISRRGQALRRRMDYPAMPSERETKPQARRAQLEENLQAAQEAARQARQQAHERTNTAGYQQGQDSQQARQTAGAQANADKAHAEHAAETRAAEAEQAQQAVRTRIISARQDRVSAASQQPADATAGRRLVKYRPEEADRLGQSVTSEGDAHRLS